MWSVLNGTSKSEVFKIYVANVVLSYSKRGTENNVVCRTSCPNEGLETEARTKHELPVGRNYSSSSVPYSLATYKKVDSDTVVS